MDVRTRGDALSGHARFDRQVFELDLPRGRGHLRHDARYLDTGGASRWFV